MNHQNHSNNAKKQKNFQMTKHLHRDLSTTKRTVPLVCESAKNDNVIT